MIRLDEHHNLFIETVRTADVFGVQRNPKIDDEPLFRMDKKAVSAFAVSAV